MPTSDRGGRDRDGRATSSLAADAARTESGGGKKSKMQQRYLNVTSNDLWRIRDKLSGKKSSLAKTYETNKEANDKVYEIEPGGFEVCAEMKEAEDQFDGDFDESLKLLFDS